MFPFPLKCGVKCMQWSFTSSPRLLHLPQILLQLTMSLQNIEIYILKGAYLLFKIVMSSGVGQGRF